MLVFFHGILNFVIHFRALKGFALALKVVKIAFNLIIKMISAMIPCRRLLLAKNGPEFKSIRLS